LIGFEEQIDIELKELKELEKMLAFIKWVNLEFSADLTQHHLQSHRLMILCNKLKSEGKILDGRVRDMMNDTTINCHYKKEAI